MTALTPLEAYDLIFHSAQLQDRLSAALAALTKKQGLKREKEWLSGAVELMHSSREGVAELVERSLQLPELTAVREEHAVELQGRWVDALERLLAGITFHAGSRAPLIETLFPKQKLPALRRAKRELVEAYATEWEKRLAGSYVKRMLAQEPFAFALPVIEEVRTAFAPWKAAFSGEGLPEEQALSVRAELAAAAKKLETPIRQARLIAEAALTPVSGAFEISGIGLKPRKHSVKVAPAATAETGFEPADAAAGAAEPKAGSSDDAPKTPAAGKAGGKGANKAAAAAKAGGTIELKTASSGRSGAARAGKHKAAAATRGGAAGNEGAAAARSNAEGDDEGAAAARSNAGGNAAGVAAAPASTGGKGEGVAAAARATAPGPAGGNGEGAEAVAAPADGGGKPSRTPRAKRPPATTAETA